MNKIFKENLCLRNYKKHCGEKDAAKLTFLFETLEQFRIGNHTVLKGHSSNRPPLIATFLLSFS